MIALTTPPPSFEPGQLVKHRRYGYRGVVVERDLSCKAPDEWYQRNQTQPDRLQPWYHVLVHANGGNMTYAAQTSLVADDSSEPIEHPLIDMFFEEFTGEAYVRNDHPFPGQ